MNKHYIPVISMQVKATLKAIQAGLENDYSAIGNRLEKVFLEELVKRPLRSYAPRDDYISVLQSAYPIGTDKDPILNEILLETIIQNLNNISHNKNSLPNEPLKIALGHGNFVLHEGIYGEDYAFMITSANTPVKVGEAIQSGRVLNESDDVKLVLTVANPEAIQSAIDVLQALLTRVTYSLPVVVTNSDGQEEDHYPT